MKNVEQLNLHCEILTTERLVLRPPHADDVEDMSRLANNFNVAKRLGTMPHPYFDADARDFLDKISGNTGNACVYAITHADTGEMMGVCGLHAADKRYALPYIGYWLGEQHWGHGYATEAARAVVDMFFKVGMLNELMITCLRDNEPSRRVIEKCGGVYWKPGEQYAAALGETRPVDHYRVTRENWMGAVAA